MKMFISLKYCYSKDHYKIDDKIGNNLIQRTQFSSSSFSFFLCVQLCMRACAYHAYIIYDDISYMMIYHTFNFKKKLKNLKKKKKWGGRCWVVRWFPLLYLNVFAIILGSTCNIRCLSILFIILGLSSSL